MLFVRWCVGASVLTSASEGSIPTSIVATVPAGIWPVKSMTKPVTVPVGGVGASPSANGTGGCATPSMYQVIAPAVAPSGYGMPEGKPPKSISASKKPRSEMLRLCTGPFDVFVAVSSAIASPPAGSSAGVIVLPATTSTVSGPIS